jgi:hypothetical protein
MGQCAGRMSREGLDPVLESWNEQRIEEAKKRKTALEKSRARWHAEYEATAEAVSARIEQQLRMNT